MGGELVLILDTIKLVLTLKYVNSKSRINTNLFENLNNAL